MSTPDGNKSVAGEAQPYYARGMARLGLGRILIALWGVGGVTILLGRAVVSLTDEALYPWLTGSLTPFQMAVYLTWVVVNAYTEGYRAFQRQFCPRVVGRSLWLAQHPRPLLVAIAPAFAMGLVYARRRRLIVSWSVVIILIGVIALVRTVPQPWRGVIDGGVVVGLAWGVLVLWSLFLRALFGGPVPVAADLPETDADEVTAARA